VAEILIDRQRMLPRQVLPRQLYPITRRCDEMGARRLTG